jgi:uncharacterized membrane protein
MATSTSTPTGHTVTRYKMHWHVLFTHFPVSLFGAAFGFQILHLFPTSLSGCFETATTVSLIGAAAMMIPTILTGWFTWKKQYKGARVPLFQRKIAISYAILAVSIALVVWRTTQFDAFQDVPDSPWHWLYLAGNTLLIMGAVAEGYYGGRLNHR